jgi:predicted TIM-barrel fold metal-dependent hydrolase
MLPNSILRAYLEPLLELDGLIDMSIDREQDWPMSEVDAEMLISSMDAAGIDKSVVLPLDFGRIEEPRATVEVYNEWVFESCASYGDRLIPFIGVDPMRGKRAHDLIEKMVKKFDAKGVKIYPGTGFRPDDSLVGEFWNLVNDLNLIVVTHAGASWGPLDESFNHPIYFKNVLERFPSIKIIIAHLGGKWRFETYELAREFENVYTDCSALQGWLPSQPEIAISRLREAASLMPDRLIFGSDWPLFDMSYPHSQWVRFLVENNWADEEVKERVLGKTFLSLV